MKLNTLTVVALFAGCLLSQAVEYGQLFSDSAAVLDTPPVNPESYVELQAGDAFEVVSFRIAGSTAALIARNLTEDRIIYDSDYGSTPAPLIGSIIVGPCKIWLYNTPNNSADSAISYKLTRASEVEYKQANIVSLPIDTVGAGTHEIVVEASDDLQTWTAVHSSSIGGNKAFFRTRVVTTGPLP